MFLGRAKYNLLQYKKRENPELDVFEWQIRDYRSLKTDELFSGLSSLGVVVEESDIHQFADLGKTPEEIDFQLTGEKKEEAYLYLFELWRRLCPDRKSISIFCDQLDGFIDAYDQGSENQNETILLELFDIMDESVDEGLKPKSVYKQLTPYLAHDLESFFYNYIYDQIDKDNEVGASEILENIYEYVEGNLWFEFLRIRLLRGALAEDATAMMARFLEKLKAKPDIHLAFELLYYMIETGHKELFITTYKTVLKEIKTEDHFMEMLEIIFSYYSLNDLEREENLIRELIQERKKIPVSQKISSEDKEILSQFI
jgi:hypothetical protein